MSMEFNKLYLFFIFILLKIQNNIFFSLCPIFDILFHFRRELLFEPF